MNAKQNALEIIRFGKPERIMEGPVERIREEVRRRFRQLGRDGGYFCSPDQGMPWSEAHRRAVSDAVMEFGRYPLVAPTAV